MTVIDFEFLRRFLRECSGLVLSADKQYLVQSRLLPVAHRAGLAGVAELVQRLRSANSPGLAAQGLAAQGLAAQGLAAQGLAAQGLAAQVVEAMTTNESFFFRDKIPFDHFRDTIMPKLIATRASRRRIRIWCAAASTGQEPYSLAMSLMEMGNRISGWRIEILATDISNEVLEKARSGIYSQFEVQRGLPIAVLLKYFTQISDGWQIAPDIRAMVRFLPLNLIGDFSHLGVFDLVFCRNVLLYFDQETKTRVLDRVARVMDRDGYLVLGAAETVVGLTDRFKPVADSRGLYAPSASAVLHAKAGAKAAPSLRIVAGAS